MSKVAKKIIKYVFRGLLILIIAIGLYFLAAVFGTWITTGKQPTHTTKKDSLNIYVVSSGMHTDFVLPMHHPVKDWRTHLDKKRFQGYYQHRFISFGWGDKAFFLKSTKAGFPGALTTIQATLWPTKSLIHLYFYRSLNTQAEGVYKLSISTTQYKALVNFIVDSFVLTNDQKFDYVANGYRSYDFFFKARRSYHLFFTCNNWTNRAYV